MVEVELVDIFQDGVELKLNGADIYVDIGFSTSSWTYRYFLKIDGRWLWLESKDTVKNIIDRVASGDMWAVAIFKLISVLNYRSAKEHAERAFSPYSSDTPDYIEERLFRSLWLSFRRTSDLSKARTILALMEEYRDVFVNRSAYYKYLGKFKEADIYALASALSI